MSADVVAALHDGDFGAGQRHWEQESSDAVLAAPTAVGGKPMRAVTPLPANPPAAALPLRGGKCKGEGGRERGGVQEGMHASTPSPWCASCTLLWMFHAHTHP